MRGGAVEPGDLASCTADAFGALEKAAEDLLKDFFGLFRASGDLACSPKHDGAVASVELGHRFLMLGAH